MTNIDPALRALGSTGRYQVLQLILIGIGCCGAAFQLVNNVFIGRPVIGLQCSPPSKKSLVPEELYDVDWNASQVQYGACQIAVNRTDIVQNYDCPFGYAYGYPKELSFRTEFDLVCEHSLLGGFVQSLLIMGQGVGAVTASIVSDRYGRKKVLVVSQIGLLVLGMGAGLAPTYAVLGVLKFLIGAFQQGVVTSSSTMHTELFPTSDRRLTAPVTTVIWSISYVTLALVAYLMKDFTWRYLQYALSAVSLVFLLQLWLVDESLRWLVANGKKKEVMSVIKRAARTNGRDRNDVLMALNSTISPIAETKDQVLLQSSAAEVASDTAEKNLHSQAQKLTLLDIFRHRQLFMNTLIIWVAWFTCAFSYFALIMMSTSLVGDRFLNYTLITLMKAPPGFIFYFAVNRFGRKKIIQMFYFVCGFGLMCCGILRIFEDVHVLAMMSVVMAMLGMVGASGMFGFIFFYTPEIFPTNMRNQALGLASFAGRLGGMLSPFMVDFAKLAVWAPGVVIGTLCFVVIFLFRFLPETKGTELPQTVEDVNAWYGPNERNEPSKKTANGQTY